MTSSERLAGGEERSGDPPTVSTPTLAVEHLSKTYGSGETAVTAVDDVSFTVEPGTVVGLLGPNGAGKTTTIKSILGLIVPSAGTVEVAGIDVHANQRAAYGRVGAMLEGARNVYWKLTVRENLEFFAAIGGESPAALRDRHDELLDQLDLTEKADVTVNDLSQGQKQKVSLACALARDVDVAFLDEPTLGLDVESSRRLRAEIRRLATQEEMTILLSSHDMDVVEDVCDRVIIVNEGTVVADDSVDALVDVFRTRAYRVVVEGTLDPDVESTLREGFGVDAIDRDGPRRTFEVALHEQERFSELVDLLRETDLTIVEMVSIDPDLEEVFLELTGEDAATVPADASTGVDSTAGGGPTTADDEVASADDEATTAARSADGGGERS